MFDEDVELFIVVEDEVVNWVALSRLLGPVSPPLPPPPSSPVVGCVMINRFSGFRSRWTILSE